VLAGLKVLDLSRLVPGPYATLVLADMGASVDKVEDPRGGDYLRVVPPHVPDSETGALFAALNRNKRSIALDLKSEAGAAALKRLLPRYDVLVEGFRPGVMERLGLGFPALSALHPRLVYCSLSGYGQEGPDRLRAGHDLNYLARAGVLGLSGGRGPPAMPGGQPADIGGALFAVIGILAALAQRARTGKGCWVDLSLMESATAFLHAHQAARLLAGESASPIAAGEGPLDGGSPFYALYKTADDRYLSVATLEPKFFTALCEKLGRPELAEFGPALGEAGEGVRAELAKVFASESLAHWKAFFAPVDLCVEPVAVGDEPLADPQLRARGLFRLIPGGVLAMRTPLASAGLTPGVSPELGEHGRQILEEAGFSAQEMEPLTRSEA
jgi:alpha-methylacyl-CoA racemase